MANTDTPDLIVTDAETGFDFYTGPIAPAVRLILAAYGEDNVTVVRRDDGSVLVAEHRHGTSFAPNAWGVSRSGDEDEAWRFLAGADFGPVDDEYDEAHLRRVLNLPPI